MVTRLEEVIVRRLGKSILLTEKVDPSILGGVIVRTGDLVWDGSVRGRLLRLAEGLR